jgi:hypothetical protein
MKTEKRNWLQKMLEEADTNDIWAFRKWSKGAHNYPTPSISRGPNRPKAIYAEDKLTQYTKNFSNHHQTFPTL